MKLEPKYIAPYLPYKLRGEFGGNVNIITGLNIICNTVSSLNYGNYEIKDFCPYLYPLSDLTKEIEHNGDKFVPIIELYPLLFRKPEHAEMIYNQEVDYVECHYYGGGALYVNTKHPLQNQYELITKLFEWHFNVFNLPEHLWIDINTLKK